MMPRHIALAASLAVPALCASIWLGFTRMQSGFHVEEHADWMPGAGISCHLGADSVSVLFALMAGTACRGGKWRCWRR